MKKAIAFLFAVIAAAVICSPAGAKAVKTESGDCVCRVYFLPRGGCTAAINAEIRKARNEILVQAYSITSASIAEELLRAHKRGVKVRVILDSSNDTDRYSAATFLSNAGIETRIDGAHAIAHNKLMIIDGATVITGSFNFTKAAEERNAENLLIIKSKKLASEYIANWNRHLKHSVNYIRRTNRACKSGKYCFLAVVALPKHSRQCILFQIN